MNGSKSLRIYNNPEQKPRTIMTVLGTRPEVIKLFPVIRQLESSEHFKSVVVSTSQHREMIDDLVRLFSIKLDHDLNIIRPNQTLADISTRVLSELTPLLLKNKPDLVLVQGDTSTAFVSALAAFYQKIPVAHVEAGLRSYNRMHPFPEEVNRRMLSSCCDLHFAPTVQNAENLIQERIDPDAIFVTGNTVIDSLQYICKQQNDSLNQLFPNRTNGNRKMLLVTAHRRENLGKPLENLCLALKTLADRFKDIDVVYPVHLNPNVRETVFRLLSDHARIHLLDPLPYAEFVHAMQKADLVITDSGGIQEEGPTFGKPILVFRETTERPEGVESGAVKLLGLNQERVVSEVTRLLTDEAAYRSFCTRNNPYGDGQAACRIAKAIEFYFDGGVRPEDFRTTQDHHWRLQSCSYRKAS